MEKLCAVIGFTKEMIESLLTKKEAIRCNGRIYSEEHRRKFDIKNESDRWQQTGTDHKQAADWRMVQRTMGETSARFTTVYGRTKKK